MTKNLIIGKRNPKFMSFDLKNFKCFGFRWTLLLNDCSILSVLKSSPDDLSMEYNYTNSQECGRSRGGLSYFYDGDANFQQKSHWTRAAECLKQKFQILLYSKLPTKICDIPLLVPNEFFFVENFHR